MCRVEGVVRCVANDNVVHPKKVGRGHQSTAGRISIENADVCYVFDLAQVELDPIGST
jgi:hypothetical protein